MKVLYITNQIHGSGGLERVLAVKTDYLINDFNHEVHVLTLNQKSDQNFYQFNSKLKYHNITATGNSFKYIMNYIKGLQKKVNEIQPDIISVCDDGLKGFFVPIFIRKPCPMIYERHVSKKIGHNFGNKTLKNRFLFVNDFLMNVGAKLYDKFIVLTLGNKEEWKLNNIEVIANPLPFFPDEKSQLISKNIIAVGKISEQKGFDLLVNACQSVFVKHPDWSLNIYGSKGKYFDKVKELIEKNQLEKNIKINKPTPKIKEEYLKSSIYVMSSRYEGFGMVLIEAMACGVPCISFDCPYGPSDIIKNNEDGFIIPNQDIIQLAEKICILIEDEKLRQQMGTKAKENVKRFLPENIVKKWDTLFNSLVL